jgi:hypothetical protein
MGRLVRFMDGSGGCWSRVDWESGEPAFVSISQRGVLVKRSRLGFMGAKLYIETDIHNCVAMSRVLDDHILSDDSLQHVPPGMVGAVLQSFTRLALETQSALDFCSKIGHARQLVLKGN